MMRTTIRAALAACVLAALVACDSGGTPEAAPSTMSDAEILAIGKQVAECIRGNGVPAFPEWPDPKPDGSFPLKNSPMLADGKSERFGRAVGACEQHWSGGMRMT